LPLTEFGVVTKEKIWENYKYFIEQVMPVAEIAAVKMALQRDDPPVSPLRGIGRIFINTNGIRKAIVLSNSPSHGLILPSYILNYRRKSRSIN
jgi:D-mannonate dehydratase